MVGYFQARLSIILKVESGIKISPNYSLQQDLIQFNFKHFPNHIVRQLTCTVLSIEKHMKQLNFISQKEVDACLVNVNSTGYFMIVETK